MFSAPAQIPTTDVDGDGDSEEEQHQRHYSIISPTTNDIGAQSPSNEHVDRMAGILLTYNFYEKELGNAVVFCFVGIFHLHFFVFCTGYVQGMSDLCAPIYVVMNGNEEMTFWCFVEVMNRMASFFVSCVGFSTYQ